MELHNGDFNLEFTVILYHIWQSKPSLYYPRHKLNFGPTLKYTVGSEGPIY